MTRNVSELTPYMSVHPGELLKDEIDFRGIDFRDMAEKLELSATVLEEVLEGKRALTPELALTMEAALGVNADVLVRMQSDYDIYQSRQNKSFAKTLEKIRRAAASVLI